MKQNNESSVEPIITNPRFKPSEKEAKPETLSADIGEGFSIKGRIWLEKDGETYLGFGRITLLERIEKFGSITKAAKSMKMSYRHAWQLVESMNRQAGQLLVDTSTGGKGGGGSVITPAGEKAIKLFKDLRSNFKTYIDKKQANLAALPDNSSVFDENEGRDKK